MREKRRSKAQAEQDWRLSQGLVSRTKRHCKSVRYKSNRSVKEKETKAQYIAKQMAPKSRGGKGRSKAQAERDWQLKRGALKAKQRIAYGRMSAAQRKAYRSGAIKARRIPSKGTKAAPYKGMLGFQRADQQQRWEALPRAVRDKLRYKRPLTTAQRQRIMKVTLPAYKPAMKAHLDAVAAKAKAPKRAAKAKAPARKAYVSPATARPKRIKKRQWIALQMAPKSQGGKGRSRAQAEGDWRLHRGMKPKSKPPRYAGYKRPTVKLPGRKTRRAYVRKTASGRYSHLPDWAVMEYASRANYLKARRANTESYQRRRAKLTARRQRAAKRAVASAERASRRASEGKNLGGGMIGIFSPNKGELTAMRPNKRKKRRTKAQKLASLRNIKKAQAKLRKRRSGKKRVYKRKRTYKRNITLRTKRSAAAKKAARTRKRNALKRSAAAKKAARTRKRKSYKRNVRKLVLRKAAPRRGKLTLRKAKPKRRIIRRRKPLVLRKARTRRAGTKRRYRRNISGPQFMTELTGALKVGAIATGGFVSHRALAHLIDNYGLGNIEAFKTGGLAQHRMTIAGVAAALVGIPVATKLIPGPKARTLMPFVAGMATSLLHSVVVKVANMLNQPTVVGYLSSYTNAPGRAYGSYYSFKPHQTYRGYGARGYGEYYQMQGLGQLRQAAAGVGQLRQAAAGMGQIRQAAAGMGQIRQAAAGAGEYIAQNVNGIGEYEQVATGRTPMQMNEGIYPTLNHAERALSVAEAAAGVGRNDVPLQSTVNPMMTADPISDLPGGSRAGVFEGGDGIF
jgi:hypothetical protein